MDKSNYEWKDKVNKVKYNLNLSHTTDYDIENLIASVKLSRNYHNARLLHRFTYTLSSFYGAWVIYNNPSDHLLTADKSVLLILAFLFGNAMLSGYYGNKEILTNEEITNQIENSPSIEYEKKPYGLKLNRK